MQAVFSPLSTKGQGALRDVMLAARLGESGFNVLDVPHGYLDERGCRLRRDCHRGGNEQISRSQSCLRTVYSHTRGRSQSRRNGPGHRPSFAYSSRIPLCFVQSNLSPRPHKVVGRVCYQAQTIARCALLTYTDDTAARAEHESTIHADLIVSAHRPLYGTNRLRSPEICSQHMRG